MLESREVPANFYWDPQSPTDLNSTTLSNWLNPDGVRCGVQQPFGNVVAGPNSDDTLIFGEDLSNKTGHGTVGVGGTGGSNGPSYNTLDCNLDYVPQSGNHTGPLYAPTDYFGLTLKYTYGGGTVKLIHSSYVNYFEMRWGNLNQLPVSGGGDNHVTVNNLLTWTAGTINTNAQAGFLNLNLGAHGWIDPGMNQTVATGNTIVLKGDSSSQAGSTVTQTPGSILELSNGNGVIINANSLYNMPASTVSLAPLPPPPKYTETAIKPTLSGKTEESDKKIEVKVGGTLQVGENNKMNSYEVLHCNLAGLAIENNNLVTIGENSYITIDSYLQENSAGRLSMTAANKTSGLKAVEGDIVVKYGDITIHTPSNASAGETYRAILEVPVAKSVRVRSSELTISSSDNVSSQLFVKGDLKIESESVVRFGVSDLVVDAKQTGNIFSSLEIDGSLYAVAVGKNKPTFSLKNDSSATVYSGALKDPIVHWSGDSPSQNEFDWGYKTAANSDYDFTERDFLWGYHGPGKKFLVKNLPQ